MGIRPRTLNRIKPADSELRITAVSKFALASLYLKQCAMPQVASYFNPRVTPAAKAESVDLESFMLNY